MNVSTLIVGMALLASGCTESFSPNGPYRHSLIVYSVLNVSADTQFVKVYSTHDPSVYGPADRLPSGEVIGATVTLKKDTTVFIFHDTVLHLNEGGAVRTVNAYVHYGVNIAPSGTYELTVEQPQYPAAKATVPAIADGFISPVNTQVLSNIAAAKDIELDFIVGKGAYAYLVRLLVEYEKRTGGEWKPETAEVPLGFDGEKPVLPVVDIVDQSNIIRKTYKHTVYREVIDRIRSNPADTVRFSGVVIEYQQFDESLFAYFSVVNNFPGGTTIRLDEPDYTNVTGGYGIVGMMSRKTQRFTLPADP